MHLAPKEHIGCTVRKFSFVSLLCLVFSAFDWCTAQNPIRFEFLPPEVDGTYSLGIYKGGTLIRTLSKAAGESAYTVGLNGFVATWDGRKDDGQVVPKGTYQTRGYVVPDLSLVPSTETAPVALPVEQPALFREVELVGMGTDDAPFVIGAGVEGTRKIWFGGSSATGALEGLGAGATSAAEIQHAMVKGICVGTADGLFMIDPSNWKAAQLFDATSPVWVAFQGDTIATVFGTEFGTTGLGEEDGYQKEEIPAGMRPLAGPNPATWYLAGAEGTILRKTQGDPVLMEFPYEKYGRLVAAAAGPKGSVWLVETGEDGVWELRQFAEDGEFLRQLPGGNTTILGLAASTRNDVVSMLRKEGDGSIQLVTLARKEGEENGEIVDFEETARLLVAAPAKPSKAVQVRLTRNPLEPGKAPTLAVRAGVDAEGVFLQTEEGLYLKRLLAEQGIQSASLEKTSEGLLLRVFGGSAGARTWIIKGLERAMEFKPGDLEYP